MHQNRDRGFEEEFKLIKEYNNGSTDVACANRPKNRYGNIYTYDHSRVVLSVPDEDGSDYINASFIDGYNHPNMYIASQGPTGLTMLNFWQMIWDQKCSVLVMLTKVEEKGKKKCERYWPLTVDNPLVVGRGLEVHLRSELEFAYYTVRELTLNNTSEDSPKPHYLKQFHYTAWPDYGVPSHPSSLVKFVQQVGKEYKNGDRKAPLLTHCSAGIGRTGTFITIDAMLERLQEKDNLNIYEFVTAMRTRRTFMVQTMEQYAFIHDALCDYLTCGDTSVAAHELRKEIHNLCKVDANTGKSRFQQQFELLDSVSKKPVSEDESFSRKAAVVKKNRYKDKFPYSNCYVRVPGKGPTGGADYMNASYIDSYSRNKAFIAAQAPLESTKNDVWEMIWQYRPSTVVVLCDFQKERQEACSRFWPDEREKTLNVGFLKVNNGCTERDTTYDITRLEVFDSRKESSKVLHVSLFHLKDWDKDGRPTTEAVLRLMGDVQNTTASPSGDVIPAVVMCDDGMGRSGVFICAMSEVERVKVEGQFDVFQTIKGMRIQRPHMVETADQYKLCFEILQSYLDSFDTYANFKAV
jgi:protein tyrosine phosphatase